MIKTYCFALAALCCLIVAPVAFGQAANDLAAHKACIHCGMDRTTYNYSRMLIQYDDGSAVGVCSIHCAATELARTIDKKPVAIKVGDFGTKQLIDAEKAVWVIGGTKPGVMSQRAKWAFEKKEDAETFIRTNQGQQTTFEQAMSAAYADMTDDVKAIRERRAAKRAMQMQHGQGAKP